MSARIWVTSRRRLLAWHRDRARSYWRLRVEHEQAMRALQELDRQISALAAQVHALDADLAEQRARHVDDLAQLGRSRRALRDVSVICTSARAAGVNAVNLHRIQSVLHTAGAR